MIGLALRDALLLAGTAFSGKLALPSAAQTTYAVAPAAAHESYLGFDTNVYPGDNAMNAWKRTGKYDWVGYYLEAPCHKDASWSGTRARLTKNGWGLAVIYVGQQTWGKSVPASAQVATS